jgi:methylenetetrahydrofolate reductase (NADPH)
VTAVTVQAPDSGCPKRMVFGPCGGVRPDLSCELDLRPCPFAHRGEVPAWAEPAPRPPVASALLAAMAAGRPAVLTDLTLPPYDVEAVGRLTKMLRGSCDAVLVGEHQDRPDFPPTMMATLLREAGMPAWVTLTCRDRNRLVLEQELAGLAQVGVDGVLCVTGDVRAPGTCGGVTSVFDLDGTRLAALAAEHGLAVAVPESPAAEPVALRPHRLLAKERAGARVVVLNHLRSAVEVSDFVARARGLGVTVPVVASTAVYTDAASAAVLQRFPGLHLDGDRVARVLASPDPEEAGIAAAVAEAEELLAVDGVAGVNLSGWASSRGERRIAEVMAEVGSRIRAGS